LDLAVNAKAKAGESGTAWPEVHYLGPQHPVLDWAADKLLNRVDRNEAIAIPCNVAEPTFLVSGVWSNKLGEPIATAWLAATVEDGLVTFEEMFETLRKAGVSASMVNPQWEGDLELLKHRIEAVVDATANRMGDTVADALETTWERLGRVRKRLEAWQKEARRVADLVKSDSHRARRIRHIESVTRQIQALISDQTPADAPLIRIVGALLPTT
jgi:hypothetical protein